MQLAMIGLGRMGANMARRLMADGHECVAYDLAEAAIAELEADGATGARSLEQVVAALTPPRHVWVMVPAAFVGSTVDLLTPLLSPGDTIIDGGNSWYRDDIDRSGPLKADHGINFLDVGTSGGIHGLDRGYCLMVGGDTEAVTQLAPIFPGSTPRLARPGARPSRRRPSTGGCTVGHRVPGTS
jgi:6-phosphogluconate dehydrogenase